MIYTSYYPMISKLKNIVPISIAGKAPNWYNGIEYKKLAPKWKLFSEWKKSKDNNFYIKYFKSEVLDLLDLNKVLKELYYLSNGNDFALICYEKPNDFCHRHLVADWFNKNGYETREWNNVRKDKTTHLFSFI